MTSTEVSRGWICKARKRWSYSIVSQQFQTNVCCFHCFHLSRICPKMTLPSMFETPMMLNTQLLWTLEVGDKVINCSFWCIPWSSRQTGWPYLETVHSRRTCRGWLGNERVKSEGWLGMSGETCTTSMLRYFLPWFLYNSHLSSFDAIFLVDSRSQSCTQFVRWGWRQETPTYGFLSFFFSLFQLSLRWPVAWVCFGL